jgi:hypothetical protein
MPSPVVFTRVATLVATLVTATEAPARMPPCASLTSPLTVARSTWASATPAVPSSDRTQIKIGNRFMARSY